MQSEKNFGVVAALLSAVLFALSIPCSKLLLADAPPTMTAAFLYFGAGLGLLPFLGARGLLGKKSSGTPFTRRDLPNLAAMLGLDIAAAVFMMQGLSRTASANASLLNNFEVAATAVFALLFFRERVSGQLWAAIALTTAASILLSFEGEGSLRFSAGSLLVLLACVCWGLDNNFCRRLSQHDPLQLTVCKGLSTGAGSLLLAFLAGEQLPAPRTVCLLLLLGFAAYGLSICLFVRAQRALGAARTSTLYAISPFAAALLSFVLLREKPNLLFYVALPLMLCGALLAVRDARKNA